MFCLGDSLLFMARILNGAFFDNLQSSVHDVSRAVSISDMQKDWCGLLHDSLVLVLLFRFFVFLEDVLSSFFVL
ncbi:hypothetical protein JHK86_014966 [Glycine max]|nr:hypothetical protein JHK86_014966 [Glycine max]